VTDLDRSREGELAEDLCRAALAMAEPIGLTSACVSRAIDHRPREVFWASDARARQLDDLQLVLGEGPGVTALVDGGPVIVPDIRDYWSRGWVTFERAATELGVRSIWALPLQIGEIRLGVLTLNGADPSPHDSGRLSDLLTICGDLSVRLLAADTSSGDWTGALGRALDPPLAVTSQAAGMVMVQLESTLTEAMARLCAHAFAAGLTLEEVSRAVVGRTLRFEPDQLHPDHRPGNPDSRPKT